MTSEIRSENANAYKIGKKMGVKVGICDKDHRIFLILRSFSRPGIDSISVNSDSVIKTVNAIYEAEQFKAKKYSTE
jgi:phosphoenolpyruvate synthase/pyruvate phosphate dikinase